MHQLFELDTWLLVLLNGSGNAWLDRFWFTFTNLQTWLPMGVVACVMLWRTCDGGWKRRTLMLLTVAVLVVALDQAASGLLKPLTCRLRPSHTPGIEHMLHYVNGYRGGRYSFPSGHATTSAGIATWLWLTFRRPCARACFALFALGMGYSRVYLGVHYPSDVLAGFVLGTAMAAGCHRLVCRRMNIHDGGNPRLLLCALGLTLTGIVVAVF